MPDTIRTVAELLALYADNVVGDISAQDARDLIVTMFDIRLLLSDAPAESLGDEAAAGVLDTSSRSDHVHPQQDPGTFGYTPGEPTDWNEPVPSAVNDALDQLAARIKALEP